MVLQPLSPHEPLVLSGVFNLSMPGGPQKTVGKFHFLIEENRDVFRRYFSVDLFAGSLNLMVVEPSHLQSELDAGRPIPAFTIPRDQLRGMPDYIGAGQAWRAQLESERIKPPHDCWLFRRVGSRVRKGILEVVSDAPLMATYDLRDGEWVRITVFPGAA